MSVVPVLIEVWRKRRHQKTGEITEDGRDLRYDEQAERDEVERKAFGA